MSQTNPLLKNAASKIGGAMDKIKFDDSLTYADFQKIRADVEEARNDLAMFSEINQDPTGLAVSIGRSIEFMDLALQTLDNSPNLL